MIGRYERKLFRQIEKWGGKVVCVDNHYDYSKMQHVDFDCAPFTHHDVGVNFRKKTLFYSLERQPWWPEIIHEMGHVFGSKHGPTSKKCVETHFFGWEWLLAKKIRAPMTEWFDSNYDFAINPECECHRSKRAKNVRCIFPDFGSFPRKCQKKIINHWVEFGKKYGNIKDGKPVPVR